MMKLYIVMWNSIHWLMPNINAENT